MISSGVAPFAGAWIEIVGAGRGDNEPSSLPSRERGLKSFRFPEYLRKKYVAPFAGAWIEICNGFLRQVLFGGSLPSRERGLKLRCSCSPDAGEGRSLRGSVD